MKFIKILLLLPLIWLPTISEAEEVNVPIDPNCIESQQECQIRANKKEALRQRCLADPEWCKERRDKKRRQREERWELKRQCKHHPEQCAALTREFKKRQKQRREENQTNLRQKQERWCKNNPAACEQWEIEMKEVRRQCQALKHQLMNKFPDRPRKMW